MKCDAVFEGGGVKGLAFIGAVEETEKRGYQFHRLAGTSAGSIVASLLAAGYTAKELRHLMLSLDFRQMLGKKGLGKLPIIGRGMNIVWNNGIYSSFPFEKWMAKQLQKKGVHSFGDLPEGKLKIIASDITQGRLVVLPDDLDHYGIQWKNFSISQAVRMSVTIPYFFQPVPLRGKGGKKSLMVDGGLLSNFPIWLFDSATIPRWPTFGYRFRGDKDEHPTQVRGPISLLLALFATMMEAHDKRYIDKYNAARTMFLPVLGMKATDFNISEEQKLALVEAGREEARLFFDKWSFTSYVHMTSKKKKPASSPRFMV